MTTIPTMAPNNYSLPQGSYSGSLGSGSRLNTKQNIIAGPNSQDYWYHSAGAERAEIKEESAFPIQGNIGSLVSAEASNYTGCSLTTPNIGSGPNCSGTFTPDIYTKTNTCGEQCNLQYPESYGLKQFGFPDGTKRSDMITNAHQIHSYQNIRAGTAGEDNSNGCYEYIPALKSDPVNGTCYQQTQQVYSQVGQWEQLPMYSNLVRAKFNKGPI